MSEAPARSDNWALIGLFLVGLGALVVPLDSAVNIAFDPITRYFSIPPQQIHWIVVVFVLTQSCLTIVFGKLADRHGHRRLFMIGLAISVLAFVLCAAATHYAWLAGWRMMQGIGAGLLLACGPALSTFVVTPERKRFALAVYTMVTGIGMLVGPLFGGWLVQIFDWPVVFWMRAPIALLALILIWKLSGKQTALPMQTPQTATPAPFDVRGSLALILMLFAIGAFMLQAHHAWAGQLSRWVCLLIAGAALLWLWVENKRATDPVMDLRYFLLPGFAALQFGAVLIHITTFSLFLFLPYTLAAWPQLPLGIAGLILAMFAAGMVLSGFVGARLSAAVSSRWLISAGLALCALALAACGGITMSADKSSSALWLMAGSMLLSGFGAGLFQVGHLDATTDALPVTARGVAGSIAGVTRVLGIVFAAGGLFWLHEQLGKDSQDPFSYGPTIFICGATLALYAVYYFTRHARQATVKATG